MGLEALIFDVDGTLAETEEVHRQAFNAAFAEAGHDWHWDRPRYADLLKVTGGKERIARFLADRSGGDPERVAQVPIAELHGRKTEHYNRAILAGRIGLRPGISELIAAALAADIRLAIATTTSLPNVETLLAATLGPAGAAAFTIIAAGDMVARKKPAPDIYELALAGLGLPAGRCLALEDSRNGLMSALAAGIPTVITVSAYTDGEAFDGALAVGADLPALAGSTDGPAILDALRSLHGRSPLGKRAGVDQA
jgi:HAD superfamily hydrolase (TIGR01509 family)